MPRNVSSKGLVKSAKKEARAAEKKAEDMPLAKVSWTKDKDTGFYETRSLHNLLLDEMDKLGSASLSFLYVLL